MICNEEQKEHKYDRAKFIARLDRIIEHWDEIKEIINSEVPTASELSALLGKLGAPKTVADIGISDNNLGEVFEATRDIRDKYVLSRLVFDLGLTGDVKQLITE